MREIKCRAWDKVTVTYLYSDKFPSMWQFFKELENRGIRHYETEWYVNLKDKNGKEIYEGDIVKNWYSTRSVKYYCGAWWLMESNLNDKPLYGNHYTREVIGNIYENPELLKENSND